MLRSRNSYAFAALGVITSALVFFAYGMVRVARADMLFAFMGTVADFTAEHQSRLPNDWNEFQLWSLHARGEWPPAELTDRIDLLWGADVSDDDSYQQLVFGRDKTSRDVAQSLTRSLQARIFARKKVKDGKLEPATTPNSR